MNNQDKAAEVLRNTSAIAPHRGMGMTASETCAQALAENGLLMPDLPELDSFREYAMTVESGTLVVYAGVKHVWVEPDWDTPWGESANVFLFSPEQAREMAYAVLAAAHETAKIQESKAAEL